MFLILLCVLCSVVVVVVCVCVCLFVCVCTWNYIKLELFHVCFQQSEINDFCKKIIFF